MKYQYHWNGGSFQSNYTFTRVILLRLKTGDDNPNSRFTAASLRLKLQL